MKEILQDRVEKLQREKVDINYNKEMEEEYKVNKLNSLLSRLTKEKQKIEEYLSFEVKEKQDLVMFLAKEKKNLTNELQALLKEIRKSKHKIKKYVGPNTLRVHPPSKIKTGNHVSPRLNQKVSLGKYIDSTS